MAAKTRKRAVTQNNLAKAVSHTLRSEILTIISQHAASPAEMSRELEDSVGNVDYHTKRLVELDCAEEVYTRPARGATEHFYRATIRNFVGLADAQTLHPAVADHYAGQVMQQVLKDFLDAAGEGSLKTQEDLNLTTNQHVLDEEGWHRALEILERARVEVEEEEARSTERLAGSGKPGIAASVSQLCFQMPPK